MIGTPEEEGQLPDEVWQGRVQAALVSVYVNPDYRGQGVGKMGFKQVGKLSESSAS